MRSTALFMGGTSQMRPIGALEQLKNFRVFIGHVGDVNTLRKMREQMGDGFSLFGGTAVCGHSEVKELMAREPDKVDWFYGPMQDRNDYFASTYMPFLQKGPEHTERRRHILGRVAEASQKLADFEALLAADPQPARALNRFLFRHLAGIELTDAEHERIMDYRKWAAPLSLLPKWMRSTVLLAAHRRVTATRQHFLERFAAVGLPFAENYFDILWFNSATLAFYPEKAIEALRAQPELLAAVKPESALLAGERPKTRALIHEMLRIHSRIASVNYRVGEEVKIAVIATATVDPARYPRPLEVDLGRDHSDAVSFAGPSPVRSCPGQFLAPDLMACVITHHVNQSLPHA